MTDLEQRALDYHSRPAPGKLEVVPSKPCRTQDELSLAYTPGVASPCLKIAAQPELAADYTNRGNLVAVVSNGSAVLGLGNIGALAGKPVMEGKGVLFKRFADIDVFDLEVASEDPEQIITLVKLLEPTFGGINLEDIRAPECFYIEEQLQAQCSIPVFHDDQHGTAVIAGAGLLNALEVVGKKIDNIKVVLSGAGAAGIACAKYFVSLGVKKDHLVLCDSRGVVRRGRSEGMNSYKAAFAADTKARTLAEALKGADVFFGVSARDIVDAQMLRSMNDRPVVFALANPNPEITYEAAKAARPEVIICTGRSDKPNQVNNVLGFPFIFRGALDAGACCINEAMKHAASRALADLAKEPVPREVCAAYGLKELHFGPDYIIPKPFDPRVLIMEAGAVARAAVESGAASGPFDPISYEARLQDRLDKSLARFRA
jgi:malate dehydrogenase (oxaloacetate-decarboxylating)(NADP+)